MNQETATLHSLGEVDEELRKKVIQDVEMIVAAYIHRNSYSIGTDILSAQAPNLERLALRALKTHLNNAGNIY